MFTTSNSSIDKEFAENYNAEFVSKPITYNEIKLLVEHFVSKCRLEIKKNI